MFSLQVVSFIDEMKATHPGLSNYSIGLVRGCAYGRTNPHLYEGRPKISMLLQVCDSMMMYVTATTPPSSRIAVFQAAPYDPSVHRLGQGMQGAGRVFQISCRDHFFTHLLTSQLWHSIELVVNVDHPSDHEAWANASYATGGVVVPVFSNNIHEIRAYNLMARVARGDIVVLLQVRHVLKLSA